MSQSLQAVCIDGVIALTGVLGESSEEPLPDLMAPLWQVCTVRGVLLGTRRQMSEMCEAVEKWGIKPVVDEKIFKFEEAKEAFRYLESQKHFSKVVITIN